VILASGVFVRLCWREDSPGSRLVGVSSTLAVSDIMPFSFLANKFPLVREHSPSEGIKRGPPPADHLSQHPPTHAVSPNERIYTNTHNRASLGPPIPYYNLPTSDRLMAAGIPPPPDWSGAGSLLCLPLNYCPRCPSQSASNHEIPLSDSWQSTPVPTTFCARTPPPRSPRKMFPRSCQRALPIDSHSAGFRL